jgi:hypothetical protein
MSSQIIKCEPKELTEQTDTMMRKSILLAAVLMVTVEARRDESLELPSIFERGDLKHCEDNGVVSSWCDSSVTPGLECVMLPGFDQYGCSCHGHAHLCPSDCVGGKQADQKLHYGIQCLGIPQDEPNYVLKETHEPNHCESNAIVSSWCDDFVDKTISCSLHPEVDEYMCLCKGHAAACPMECIGGEMPSSKTHFSIRCSGIPVDQPNYILKADML